MRGKVNHVQLVKDNIGITPAYAGKSRIGIAVSGCRWDHPRLCGEKPNGWTISEDVTGSPPPMRGKGKRFAAGCRRGRITPAYAGKSLSRAAPSCAT